MSASTSMPFLARGLHHLDGALPATVGRIRVVAHVEVGDLGADPAGAGDLEELGDRVQDPGVAVADVARVDAVVLAGDRVQAHELRRRRLAARVELEPGRHAERAGLHRLPHEAVHQRRLQLGRVRAGDAGGEPDRVVPDEPGEVRAVPDVREEVEVLAERRPRDHRAVVAERVEPAAHVLARVVGDRRVAPAAVADDLGRHALADGALGGRVREQREVAVAVRVDEAGADDLPGRVDDAGLRWHPSPRRPTSTILPPSIATSPRNGGLPAPSATQPLRIRTSGIAALTSSVGAADVRAEARIEDVAQAVAEEVEAEHDDHDREPGEDREPRVDVEVASGRC